MNAKPARGATSGAVIAALVVLVVIGIATLWWAPKRHTLTNRTEFAPVESLTIGASSADVIIAADNTDAIEVIGTYSWSGDRSWVEPTLTGDRLELPSCNRRWLQIGIIEPCRVSYRVLVPAGTQLTGGTTSGDLTLQGPMGATVASTVSGDLDARSLTTVKLDASSNSGDVSLGRGIEAVNARTGSGTITGAQLSATTFYATNGSGRVEALFASTPDTVDVTTTSGSATVLLPRNAYSIDATSGSGRVDVDASLVSYESRRNVLVRSGSGGVTVGAAQ